MRFVGRRRELHQLDEFLAQKRAGLMVLYGRRRVGKTSLVSHWLDRLAASHQLTPQNVIFWTATAQSAASQLRDFSQALMALDTRLVVPPTPEFAFPTWDAALGYLADLANLRQPNAPLVVVIDELTYLVQSDPALVSVLQRVWDHRLSQLANLRLILSGSLVGVMEQQVLSTQSPLYGRATSLMRLRPLPFGSFVELFPTWSPAERVAVYAVCGGIPSYLSLFEESPSFTRGLRDQALKSGSLLLSDSALLLNERLSDPYVYASVLASIASGFHTWTEIARMAGVPESNLGHYLQTLQALSMVERRDPVLAEAGGRRGRYHVSDPFLRFHYRFLQPHRTAIERGELARVTKTISEDLRAFIGTYVFEELCREWVSVAAEQGRLDFLPEQVGAFWSGQRGQAVQLDIVAASRRDKHLLIGEAQWSDKPVAHDVLVDLIKRSQLMPQGEAGWQTQYVLFSRGGFTEATRHAAKDQAVRLVTLEELEQSLIRAA